MGTFAGESARATRLGGVTTADPSTARIIAFAMIGSGRDDRFLDAGGWSGRVDHI